uniref:GOST seven transmembrane domain-containing protein n=1 Tax=Arcella intermedia TaxID=1963864 RepID=A0A6B2L2A9_9EUKA|eukprot:TRINITY_DN24061_c0_g1_i1.p1 TRINITY_DN24061_c0_g1~~TRINITY_DN24061_c0_g1_i1.p1  ORF type:complete len:510 (-),score=76.61 TRINITY_DN24061_c0_g1_i1:46-1575(-)
MWTILFSILLVHGLGGGPLHVTAQIFTFSHQYIPKNDIVTLNFGVSSSLLVSGEEPAYLLIDVVFQPLEYYLEDPTYLSETEMVVFHSSQKGHIGSEGWCCTEDLFQSGVCPTVDSMYLDFQHLHMKDYGDYYKSEASDVYYWRKNNTEAANKVLLVHSGMWYFVITDCDPKGTLKMMDGNILFHNPSGFLSATLFPNVPMYSSLTTAYFGLFLVWASLMWVYRKNLVRIQYVMLLAMGIGCVTELVWLIEWNFYNMNGNYILWLTVLGSVLTAIKITIIRTLILLVSIGYSIIYPTLDLNPKLSVILLTILYGTAEGTLQYLNALKNLGNSVPAPAQIGVLVFITIINGIYFIWIGYSLYNNKKILKEKKLKSKRLVKMYTYLCYGLCAIGTLCLIFFVIEHILLALGLDEPLWSSWWLFSYYWEYLVFFVLAFVSFTWRPNARNDKFDVAYVGEPTVTPEKEPKMSLQDAPLMYKFKREPGSPVSLKSPSSSSFTYEGEIKELEVSF